MGLVSWNLASGIYVYTVWQLFLMLKNRFGKLNQTQTSVIAMTDSKYKKKECKKNKGRKKETKEVRKKEERKVQKLFLDILLI